MFVEMKIKTFLQAIHIGWQYLKSKIKEKLWR